MSGTNAGDSQEAPSGGLSVDEATSRIDAILSRDSGETEEQDDPPGGKPPPPEGEPEEEAEPETEEAEPGEEEPGEDDTEEGEEADGEDAEADQAKAAGTVTVEFDGKAVTLTAAEVKDGFLRAADYTRKTSALAEERKALHGEYAAVRQEREQYGTLLPALMQQIQALQPQEPDWQRLAVEDPVEFNRLWAEKQLRDQKLGAIRQEQMRLQAIAQQEADQAEQQTLTGERQKLLAAIPAWKDAEKWKQDRVAIRDYLKGFGYGDAEISAVTDSRAVMIARKAMLYDKAAAAAPKPGTTAAPTPRPAAPRVAPPAKPGTANGTRTVTELTRSKQRFAKTHSLKDAADLIGRLI